MNNMKRYKAAGMPVIISRYIISRTSVSFSNKTSWSMFKRCLNRHGWITTYQKASGVQPVVKPRGRFSNTCFVLSRVTKRRQKQFTLHTDGIKYRVIPLLEAGDEAEREKNDPSYRATPSGSNNVIKTWNRRSFLHSFSSEFQHRQLHRVNELKQK